MKIEKLTENKIRVIINDEDLKQNHTDLHTIMTKSLENQGLFLNILSKAEKEVGFYTENCKLLIEAFSTPDDLFVFTITKYSENDFTDVLLNSPKKLKEKLSILITQMLSINLMVLKNFATFVIV